MNCFKKLFLISVFLGGLIIPCFSVRAEDIAISENTVLDHDISGYAFISENNITLDCNGHSISNGLTLMGRTKITVKNCKISSNLGGIIVINSSDNFFIGNEISSVNPDSTGVIFVCSYNNTFAENTISNNKTGIGMIVS